MEPGDLLAVLTAGAYGVGVVGPQRFSRMLSERWSSRSKASSSCAWAAARKAYSAARSGAPAAAVQLRGSALKVLEAVDLLRVGDSDDNDTPPLAAGTLLEKPLLLLPLVPAAVTVWAFVKMVRSTDELQRRILYQALSVGFVVTFVATLAYSVLEDLGLPHLSAVWWWGTLVLSWIVGLAISSRRYR